ncbi:unnamed protein product, partial [Chrysoparadoxa australica]
AHDKELWYSLVEYSLQDKKFLGDLLDHAGVYNVDISALVREIPEGKQVPDLKQKLTKITSDFAFQITLHETSLSSLRNDCLDKVRRLNQVLPPLTVTLRLLCD